MRKGKLKVVQSYGMGVESATILTEWLDNPDSRDFEFANLMVMAMQVGDEDEEIKRLNETHLFPLLREHRVRFVELARAGPRQADGIVVLQDTREPYELHIEGVYKLSDELKRAGTVPQVAGARRCSLKFKAWVGEQWLAREFGAAPYRHVYGYNADEQSCIIKSEEAIRERTAKYRIAFGFNVDEQDRIKKARLYDTPERLAEYPLAGRGRSREWCEAFLLARYGERWQKSACKFCPFNQMVYKEHPAGIARLSSNRLRLIEALLIERNSLTFNPRGHLYRDRALIDIVRKHIADVIPRYEETLSVLQWGLYRVRRIYKFKGKADRSVERIATGPREEINDRLLAHDGKLVIVRGVPYVYKVERHTSYPAYEEFYSAGPAYVEDKTRYGLDHFNARWNPVQIASAAWEQAALFGEEA